MSVLQLTDVTIGYDGHPALRDVNLTVNEGAVVAVLGPNGSGKSTLVRGVLGLAPVLSGTITMVPRDEVGYVPQRHTVGGGVAATVAEVVATGLVPGRAWWRPFGAADRTAVARAIAQVDLTAQADQDLAQLSGGQQRRALIARALVRQPRLLIMDEPTAGVDVAQQAVLADTIETLATHGVSLIVVTHEVEPFAGVVTQAVEVRDGRIDYDGPLSGLAAQLHDGHHDHLDDAVGWTPDPALSKPNLS